jgi:uncharacterized membrane protein (UPF0127 family)
MKIFINDIPLSVKLADTEIKQAKGLQNTPNLSQNSGMLFCYPHEKKVSFWMKETTIPLSIAFIDKNKLITQINDLEPLSEESIKSNKEIKWALEVNKGWFSDNNISVGDKVNIPSSKKIKIRVLK